MCIALALCMAAYAFLSAYAYQGMQTRQLDNEKVRLRVAVSEQQKLVRQREALEKVVAFSDNADKLNLAKSDWIFYDVNVQGMFSYETASQIVEQCNDSDLAYYWPIALEMKRGASGQNAQTATPANGSGGDVQLIVKGKFVARK